MGGPGVLDLGPLSAARAATSLYDHFQKIQDCERVDLTIHLAWKTDLLFYRGSMHTELARANVRLSCVS